MKSLVRRAVIALLRWCGLARYWRYRSQCSQTTILCYHDPDPDVLAAHLAVLRRFYSIMSLRDFIGLRPSGGPTALPRYPLVITLDDGRLGNARLLDPVVHENLPMTIHCRRAGAFLVGKAITPEHALLRAPLDSKRLRELEQRG